MLQIEHLSKRFGPIQALNQLSLHVDDNEIVGFVGANGAGKSTAMRITMGVLNADSGSTRWQGVPLDASTRRRIGYMPEERGLYPKMKVAEQLSYLARLHGLSKTQAQEAVTRWTEVLDIAERRQDEVQKLSLGNQQRVQLAAALVSDPDLLILDEPFSGLDPVAVDVMSSVLRERAGAGVPTLFSSHQLDVVERLCDRVVIIRSGELVADGTIAQLQATATPRWRAVVLSPVDPAQAQTQAHQATRHLPAVQIEVVPAPEGGSTLTLTCEGTDEQMLLASASSLGRLRELGPVRRPLTEIFREALAQPTTTTTQEQA